MFSFSLEHVNVFERIIYTIHQTVTETFKHHWGGKKKKDKAICLRAKRLQK